MKPEFTMSMDEINRLHEIDLAGVEEVTVDVKDISDYTGRGKNCLIFNLLLENSKLKGKAEYYEKAFLLLANSMVETEELGFCTEHDEYYCTDSGESISEIVKKKNEVKDDT